MSKLTEKDVKFIRTSTLSMSQQARLLNVSKGTICDVRQGRTWKWLK